MFNHERHSGKLFVACVILFILMLSFFIAFLVEKNKNSPKDENFTVCRTSDCQASGKYIYESINFATDPCDDFYEYACGSWIRKNLIPDSYSQIGTFASIGYKVNEKIKGLLNQTTQSTTSVAEEKVKIFYKSCMYEDATVEKNAIKEMNDLLAKLGGWPLLMENWIDSGTWKWWEAVALVKNNIGVNVILGTNVIPNFLNTSKYSLFIQKPSSGSLQVDLMTLPNILLNSTEKAEPPTLYEQFIMQIACLFNSSICRSPRIMAEIHQIVKLEQDLGSVGEDNLKKTTAIAKDRAMGDIIFRSPNFLRANGDDPESFIMKVKDLKERIKNVDWENFINIIFKDSPISGIDEMEVVAQTEDIKLLISKLNLYSNKTIASYIALKVIQHLMPYSSASFRKISFDYSKQIYGMKTETEPSESCVQLATSEMGFAVTNLYASSFMEPADIEHGKKLITSIKGGFLHTLNENDWLDKPTKEQAIKKLNMMEENVAFPIWNLNTTSVNEYYMNLAPFSETEFLKNAISTMKTNFLHEFSKLNTPVDKKNDWPANNPMTLNSFYYANLNSFYLLAGVMDLPLVSRNNLESLNYGGIGYIIGHEIMHGFDTTGARFDEKGQYKVWWTPQANSSYEKRAKCMENQYNSIVEETTSLRINGKKTLGENIADNGGIKGSYWGYKAAVKNDIRLPELENISGDKLFFISAAQLWCTNTRKEQMAITILTDTHAPAKYRVNIPFSNSIEFVHAFTCNADTKMNPKNKCVIF